MSSEEADDLARLLPLLVRAENICFNYSDSGLGILCSGLRLLVAETLTSKTVPGTPAYEAATAAINE